MLPKESIEQFKPIWKKLYGYELTDEEANERANNIYKFFETLVSSPTIQKSKQKTKKYY